MAKILVRNGTLVDPTQNICETMDLLYEDGVILEVGKDIKTSANKVYEAKNMLVIPGLVDMHVHLRDPGQLEKEDIATGTNSGISGGVTSVLCMPNTSPVIDSKEVISYVEETSSRAKARVYICAAMTKGLMGQELGDYKMYNEMGVVAVSDDGRPVKDNEMMAKVIKEAENNNLLAISHCEDIGIIAGGIINKGEISEQLMVKGMDRESENSVTKREIELAAASGGRIHIAHVSTKEAVEYIRQGKKAGVRVTCETAPHYFAYTHEKLLARDADYRMNPPLREQADVDAIIAGLKDGTIDCIATDHAPHTKREKQDFLKAPNGVVGLETSLSAGMRFLVEPGHISMLKLIELMSTNPAKILGISGGSLKVGARADLAIFDPHIQWTVLPERLNTKAKNCVFKFERLQGRVKYTLVDGELVFVMRH